MPRLDLGFTRTTCACEECSEFCLWLPGPLIPEDLIRLAGTTEWEKVSAWALEHLLASPGSKAVIGGKVIQIPTLVPARQNNGCACHWLVDGCCSVHADSPFGCAAFDSHMSGEEGHRRSLAMAHALIKELARKRSLYYRVWELLVEHDRIAPARVQSAQRFAKTLRS